MTAYEYDFTKISDAARQSCDRIEQLNAELQMRLENILRILDNCANGRDPEDGLRYKP
jgi:hypothetical protein